MCQKHTLFVFNNFCLFDGFCKAHLSVLPGHDIKRFFYLTRDASTFLFFFLSTDEISEYKYFVRFPNGIIT